MVQCKNQGIQRLVSGSKIFVIFLIKIVPQCWNSNDELPYEGSQQWTNF